MLALAYGTHVAVLDGFFEAYPFVVQIFPGGRDSAIEVPQSPMPQVGVSPSLYCQLRRVAPGIEIQREIVEIVPQLLKWKCEGACLQS